MTSLLVTIVKREKIQLFPSHTVNRGTWHTEYSVESTIVYFWCSVLLVWRNARHVVFLDSNPGFPQRL